MRKFRGSLEPFCDLKVSKYAEYLTCVSSEYITKPSATFSDKYRLPNFTCSLGLHNTMDK